MESKPSVRARMSLFQPIKENCWCFRWFNLHAFILIIRSLFKPLIMEDLVNVQTGYWPEVNYTQYGKIKTMFPHFTVQRVIEKMMRAGMITASILAMIDAGLGFAGPIIMKYILNYVNGTNESDKDRRVAFALAGIWIGLYFIRIFVSQYWQRICAGTTVCVQAALHPQLYRKLTRVSHVYKKYITMGDFYGYLIVDISVITGSIGQFANLFGAPVTLILSVIFVCIEVGPYGLLLLLVICLTILIQLYVDFMRASIFAQKLIKYENRLAENIHMYNEFKTIRSLAWERMLVYENIRYRVPENKLNKMYYILTQIYVFITRFAPYLIIFILFLIGFLNPQDQEWNSTKVYSVIAYISTIIGPLNTLPSVIVSLFQASKAYDRIDNFFEADEYDKMKDIYLPDGTVEISHPIFSTGTRKSINRLIVRESLYIGEQSNLINHVQNLPIEVRTHQTLDDINEEDIEKFRKCLMCLNVPFNLKYRKGERLIILSSHSGSGKTSFLRAFLGLLNMESGSLKFSGKVGFASADEDFYLSKSVRQNVLFGQPYDPQNLERAYYLSGLYKELNKLTEYDNTVVDESTRIFSPAQKCLISLARAIYYNCDILLLDQFFQQFDIDESIQVYNRLCANLKDKLIIITSNTIHFLKPEDRILILDNRTAVQEGSLTELKNNSRSRIKDYYVKSPLLIQQMSTISTLDSQNQSINNAIVESVIPRKTSLFDTENIQYDPTPSTPASREIILNPNVLTNNQFFTSQGILETPIPRTPHPPVRQTLIELRYYWAFVKTGGFIFLFVLLLIAAACAAQTFATWIIGLVNGRPFGYSSGIVILIYACLQIGYAILYFMAGIFMPIVAYYNTQRLTNYFNAIIMKFKLVKMQKLSKMYLTFIIGYDYSNFFAICDQTIVIFNSVISLIATIIIMGLASYYIWIIAGALGCYCIIVYLVYRRVAREIWNISHPIRNYFFRTLQEAFVGSEVLRHYDKVQWFKLKIFDASYLFSGVWKNNNRFARHGFNILIGMAELILIAGIVFIAVGKKRSFTEREANYVGVALSAAPTLMGIVSSLMNTLSDLANGLNQFLKFPAEELRHVDEQMYNFPLPPQNWPWSGKIQLRNVVVQKRELKNPLLENINLVIPSGQIVGVYGDYDSDISTLFLLINRLKTVSPVHSNIPSGEILISDANIREFGQVFTTEHVVLLDARAPAFSGTLRYNLDPFNQYSDEEIEKTIQMVSFWEDLENDYKNPRLMEGYGSLDFIIEERGNQMKSASLQKINLMRAILKKPKVLLMEYGLAKVNTAHNQLYYSLMNTILRDCTIVIMTSYLHNLFHCDRVIGIQKGRIVEDGPPRMIASNPGSRLYKMLFLLSKSPSYQPEEIKDLKGSKKFSYGPY